MASTPSTTAAISGRQTPPPFRASEYTTDNKVHILLCASGSVASIKLPHIIRGLSSPRTSIRIILTAAAIHFFSGASDENPPLSTLSSLPGVEALYTDADEWSTPWVRGRLVLHIELRKWTDICLVAPLDANSLAKMTNGLADNLLTSVLRAWDPLGKLNGSARERVKVLAVAPAMNTAMWLHPVTAKQIRVLEEEWALVDEVGKTRPWAHVLVPKEKELACGDVGVGAMMEWQDIVQEVLAWVKQYD